MTLHCHYTYERDGQTSTNHWPSRADVEFVIEILGAGTVVPVHQPGCTCPDRQENTE